MVSGDGLTWRDEFPRVGPDCWLVVISKWYVSSSRAVDSVSSVCSALAPRRCFAWLHITLFAHVFFFYEWIVILSGCVWAWDGEGKSKAAPQRWHLRDTRFPPDSNSRHGTVSIADCYHNYGDRRWPWVLNVLAATHIHLTSPLSLSRSPSAVRFLSPSGYTLISHGVWREQWSRRGGGGLYRLLLCQVYNAKCMFPGLCTHSCGLYVFTVNIPPWDVSNKPAGIIDTDVCVCVCVGCVFVCEVRWWVKGERLSSSVTRYHYLRHLLIITSPRLQRADDWIESAP